MASDDRNKQFERGLARHLRGGSPDAACPDAELLAAYHERTLSQEEMEKWKEHIAGCARCQETLALVESSEIAMKEEWQEVAVASAYRNVVAMPAQLTNLSAEKESATGDASRVVGIKLSSAEKNVEARRRRIFRWIAPAGAIAAALLLWLGLRHPQNFSAYRGEQVAGNRNSPAGLPQSAGLPQNEPKPTNEERAAGLAAKKSSPAGNYAASPKQVSPSWQMTRPSATEQVEGVYGEMNGGAARDKFDKQAQRGNEKRKLPQPNMPRQTSEEAGMGYGSGGGKGAQVASPQVESKIADQSTDVANTNAAKTSANSVGTGVTQNSPAPARPKALDKAKEERSPNATETVEVASAAPAENNAAGRQSTDENRRDLAMKGRNTQLMKLTPAVVSSVIAAPEGKYSWRVGAKGLIEHSSDYGKTWKDQKSGVKAELITGSAPQEKICWVVGKAGTLLLTTDGGKHWKIVTTPIAQDLGRVQASDAQHATIWSAGNGGAYETENGGLSWAPVGLD